MNKTTAALAAQEIRKILKEAFPGVKFSVTSETYSMGNSIDIKWEGIPTKAEVQPLVKQYEQGHFDGMTDSYEYSNYRKDIPQVKFLFLENTNKYLAEVS